MELRQHHLQFSAKEAKQLLNESIELALSKQDIELLEQRTEGWVTGLQLTAISLQGRADTTEFIERFTGSHHYILEYLAEEVLLQQPDFVQAFLLQTSILERLSGTLCDVVTGRDDSHAILDQLHQQNLFITTLDDDRQWFRYHHLMVDLLANRLRQTTPNDEIQLLHQRASVWCKKHGSWETAISHAVQAASWERAADLVFKAYHPLFSQGRIATWQRWLEQLPYPTIQANLPLRTRQAWATFLNGQVRQAEMMLEETRQSLLFLDPTPENLALRGELATYLANIAFLDEESSTIIEMAEEALVYLPPEQVVARARATGALGLGVSLTGDTRKAMGLFHETVGLARWAGNPFFLAHSLEVVADSQYHTGQLHAAADTCREIIALGSNDRSTPLPFAGNGQIKLAGIYVEWHELEKAGEHLEKGLVLSRQEGVGYNALQDYCIQVRLFQAVGNDVKALEALRRAEDIYRTTKSRIMAVQLAACEVQHWLKAGDVVRAVSWAEGRPLMGDPIYLQALPIIGQEVQEVSLAKIHLAQGHSEAVLDIYDQICDQAQMAGRMARVIEISLLKALALQAMGDPHAALAPLRQCLVLAEPEGYVRLFLDAGVETVQLLRLARAHGIAVDYVEGLLDVFRASNLLPTSVSRALPESLTPRELQVLQLIGAGYSNQQIAEELIITLNTVKKHSSHIYEKLAVQGRTQAVARAHEIGLIEPKVHTPE